MNTITIRIEGKLYDGIAEHIGLELMGHGDGVYSVHVERDDRGPLDWRPKFLPGDRVAFHYAGEEPSDSYVGTIIDMRRAWNTGESRMLYRVQWNDESISSWEDENNITEAHV